jgi:non-specific serine/threonine protein kinase/serine/threonine-protein kinase
MLKPSSPSGSTGTTDPDLAACAPAPDPSTLPTLPLSASSGDSSADRLIGTHIGPYRIVREIGEGGMGTVYLADRDDDEFQIAVAIKVVRRGMDSQLVLERFRTERQILARLEHPYIGRLLDGGTTQDGLAYFLMEYVEGQTLTRYCDLHQLAISERLELFRKVCDAVSHAHQNLIVHRDLKPDNILVTAEGVPKLLDFGIAKLLEPPAPGENASQPTMTMVRLGTPAYSSPEQISGGPVGIASDVYSLGVILFELLTGQRPYRIDSLGWEESARIICERDATRPSSLFSNRVAISDKAAGEETQAVSRCRKTTVDGLRKRLTGDLDNILAVALRKDPSRRYRSVDQLSEELQNHLDGRPVKARGDSILYKSGKLLRRHKLAAASLAILSVLLCGSGGFAAWQAHRLSVRLSEDRQLASSFLVDVHDQIAMLPGSTPAREALLIKSVDYLNGLAHEGAPDPQLRSSLALAYERFADLLVGVDGAGLGRSAQALKTYDAARTLRESLAREAPKDANAQYQLASNYLLGSYITGRIATLADRRAYDEKALLISQTLVDAEPDNPRYQALLAKAYTSTAYGYGVSGDWSRARSYFEQAAAIRRQLSAANPGDLEAQRERANIEYRIGVIDAQAGKPREALPHLREALRLQGSIAAAQKDNGRIRSEMAATHHFIGVSFAALGDFSAALSNLHQAVTLHEAMLAADPRDARARSLLAGNYAEQSSALLHSGRKQPALASIRRAVSLQQQLMKVDAKGVPARLSLADYQSRLASTYAALGQRQDAAKTWTRAAAVYDELDREGHLRLADSRSDADHARSEAARYTALLK